MSASERRKGASGEREVVALLRAHNLPVDRTGRQSGISVRGDLTGVPGYHFEVKRQETLRVPSWLRQAREDAQNGDVPVVAFRQSGQEWHVLLPLADLARLLDLAAVTPETARARRSRASPT